MDQSINDILQTIDDAINTFQDKMPGLQKDIFDQLQPLLKEIQINGGKLLNNVNNLKLLGQLKNKLQKIIISPAYKDAVNKFIDSYNTVAALNMDYFKQFNDTFSPVKTLPIIKQLAIENTINDLVGQGLKQNLINPVTDILNTNITSGGSYASLQNQLRDHLVNNDTGEGSLVKYTKQITTDAINQYHAQYHAAIGQDLQFNWGRYVGSLITTSRQFCILLTAKQWVHKSELPEIIKGHIDGEDCKLSSTTDLPLGMIPGTDASNFIILRGGYNCAHHYFEVPDNVVPEAIRNNFANPVSGNATTDKSNAPADKNLPASKVDTIKENNKEVLAHFASKGIPFYDGLAEHWDPQIKLKAIKKGNSNYDITNKVLSINTSNERINNEYYQKKIMLHEGGHAMHSNDNIVTYRDTDKDFNTFYNQAKSIIRGKGFDLENDLRAIRSKNYGDETVSEQVGVLADTLGGLTKGQYGWGHAKSYYKKLNFGKMEVFAHVITLAKLPNDYANYNETFSELTTLMKAYGLSVLQGK